MDTSDYEAQQDELLALASIFDESVFSCSQDGADTGGQFQADVDLPLPFQIRIAKSSTKTNRTGKKQEEELHFIRYLPPIVLNFQLPPDYPSFSPPSFTLSCKWLTLEQLSKLCHKLDEIWEENKSEVILFMWTSFLKEETVEFLNLTSPLDLSNVLTHRKHSFSHLKKRENSESIDHVDGANNNVKNETAAKRLTGSLAKCGASKMDVRAIQDIASQDLLLTTLLEFDQQQREEAFKTTLFSCNVCFVEKLGSQCICFTDCEHVYCQDCMRGYFEVQIGDGSVKALCCPNEKCESQALPSQVKALVSPELYARYDRLLLQSSLDTMSDVVYCPRQSCQCPVLVEKESTFGSCPLCHYVFCIFCKLAYHGVSPCRVTSGDMKKIRAEYLKASDAEKKALEQRYGKKVIQHLVEESFSQDWLDQFSKKCPHCGTYIQKIDGCNKMTCTKCRSYFCWICNDVVSRNNPYSHFNNPASACFNKLFFGIDVNEPFPDWEDDWIEED